MIKITGDTPYEDIGGGVYRRVLAYNENIMTVEVKFDTGAIGAVHTHPHAQISYVVSGKFDATVGEERKIIGEGDSYSVERDEPHGVICLEDGVLIDVFTPMREDFIK